MLNQIVKEEIQKIYISLWFYSPSGLGFDFGPAFYIIYENRFL